MIGKIVYVNVIMIYYVKLAEVHLNIVLKNLVYLIETRYFTKNNWELKTKKDVHICKYVYVNEN